MKKCLIVVLLLAGYVAPAQKVRARWAQALRDSFDIYLDTVLGPGDMHYVYYLDAGINSGKELRRQLAGAAAADGNTVFVGIAHRGDFHEKRRRDFIPARGAAAFYGFLERELIPYIEKVPVPPARRALIGHSFGGLFATYALFRDGRLFGSYVALSPSLWVDRYALFNQEAAYAAGHRALPARLYLSAGGAEVLNYILAGNRRIKEVLEARNYEGLQLVYAEHALATHNSQVPLSLRYVLAHLF